MLGIRHKILASPECNRKEEGRERKGGGGKEGDGKGG